MKKQSDYWEPPKGLWDGDTVFVIGGGPSLTSIDLSRIKWHHTIGCNDAYMLGDWVDVCFFGDNAWYRLHNEEVLGIKGYEGKPGLKAFRGIKVSCCQSTLLDPTIKTLQLRTTGLHDTPGYIGWNHNTGAASINLAVILGAKRIVLLGFDGKKSPKGEPNWHPNIAAQDNSVYEKHHRGFEAVAEGIAKKYPEIRVINANPDSAIRVFPRMAFDDVMKMIESENTATFKPTCGVHAFSEFKDIGYDDMVIVGKGRTDFQYENLRSVQWPTIFINDAVQMERHLPAKTPSFFFAHDRNMEVWLTRIRSTPVLPMNNSHALFGEELISWNAVGRNGVGYEWDDSWRKHQSKVSTYTKDKLAKRGNLFLGCGTIHSAIHFAWFCGAKRVWFIGCDGLNNSVKPEVAYDNRITNDSHGIPKGVYCKIRNTQDWLCTQLGLEAIYVNSEDLRQPETHTTILKCLHFVWLGDPMPDEEMQNVQGFIRMNPGWRVTIWQDMPEDLPSDLVKLYRSCTLWCQKADIIRYWVLYNHGGIYLDTDMVPIRPIPNSLRKPKLWAAKQADDRVNNAAIGCETKNDGMKQILDALPKAWASSAKRARLGPDLLTKFVREFEIVPSDWVYPLPNSNAVQAWRDGKKQLPESAIMVHLWGINGSSRRPC